MVLQLLEYDIGYFNEGIKEIKQEIGQIEKTWRS